MLTIEINGLEFLVKSNISVLEACKYVGINIPRFCYHETLSVAGNCRMCLVEVGNSPKPVASCVMPISNNMKIFVDTPLVKKARESILETLLLNHPLDCPICDQGGECDLQDQVKKFGGDYSRFFFDKRGVEDKYCGPLIKTIMTRCIHCTRCVRFGSEIAGVEYLGTLNRGGDTEIGGYFASSFNSEISGNVIDLCPVGALTSKPYAFKARPWELRSVETIDLTDGCGSNVYVNFKESEILRILPKTNFEINGSIISDKARFSYDGLNTRRLQSVFFKNVTDSEYSTKSISSAIGHVDKILNDQGAVSFVIDSDLDLQSIASLRVLKNKFKSNIFVKCLKPRTTSNLFVNWLYGKISDLKKTSELCIFLGCNTRFEGAIINSVLRSKYTNEGVSIFGMNLFFDSNIPVRFISLSVDNFLKVCEAKEPSISQVLLSAQNPIICTNENMLKRGVYTEALSSLLKIMAPSSVFININSSCNTEGLSFLNIKSLTSRDTTGSSHSVFVGLEDTESVARAIPNVKKTLTWCNTHGSSLGNRAHVLVPILAAHEEEQTFINFEQRSQKSSKIFSGSKDARSFSKFVSLFANKAREGYLSFLEEIAENKSLFYSTKINFNLDHSLTPAITSIGNISTYPAKPTIEDFYLSNKVSKNSISMAKCSQEYRRTASNFY